MPALNIKIALLLAVLSIALAENAYKVAQYEKSQSGYSGRMTYDGTAPKGTFSTLSVEAMYVDANMLRMRVLPVDLSAGQDAPYAVPDAVMPGNNIKADSVKAAEKPVYATSLSGNTISVTSQGQTVLTLEGVVYESQRVSFSTSLPSESYVSGYGEHNYYYFINHDTPSKLSLWNSDYGVPVAEAAVRCASGCVRFGPFAGTILRDPLHELECAAARDRELEAHVHVDWRAAQPVRCGWGVADGRDAALSPPDRDVGCATVLCAWDAPVPMGLPQHQQPRGRRSGLQSEAAATGDDVE